MSKRQISIFDELIIDNFAGEIWQDCPVYGENYEISNTGIIRNIHTGKIVKPGADHKGYLRARLSFKNVKKSARIHRMVAIAFISNPGNLPQVNHKDGNKLNNHASNLEWIENHENMRHAVINKLTRHVENAGRPRRPVIAREKKTNEVLKRYGSIADAESDTGVVRGNITACCKGRKRSSGGYIWEYESEVM